MDQFAFYKNVAILVYPQLTVLEWESYARVPTEYMKTVIEASGCKSVQGWRERYDCFMTFWAVSANEFPDQNKTVADDVSKPSLSEPQSFYSVTVQITQQTQEGLNINIGFIVDLMGVEKRGATVSEAVTKGIRMVRYAVEVNGLTPLAVSSSAQPVNDGVSEEIFKADSLTVGWDDKSKQKSFKVRGGEWQKFGVVTYPETLLEGGFKPDNLQVGDVVELKGRKVVCKMKDSKPFKIIRFL